MKQHYTESLQNNSQCIEGHSEGRRKAVEYKEQDSELFWGENRMRGAPSVVILLCCKKSNRMDSPEYKV